MEKFLDRYETLVAERGEAASPRRWNAQEADVAEEFLDHARQIRAERDRCRARGPRAISSADRRWGGATIAYRRRLIDAPSYTLNHEEVAKLALEEGIRFAECLTPERRCSMRSATSRVARLFRNVKPTPSQMQSAPSPLWGRGGEGGGRESGTCRYPPP